MNEKQTSQLATSLDREFYENFDTRYFMRKNEYLFFLLCNLDDYAEKSESVMKYEDVKARGGKMKKRERKELEKHLQAEIALNYYHAIETLFRLFLGHIDIKNSPWLTIATSTNFKKFKKDIKNLILKESLSIDEKDFDESLMDIVFMGNAFERGLTDKEKWNENIKRCKEFLKLFAKNILETPHYNAYKHGLAVFHTDIGIELGDITLANYSDAFTFIEMKKEVNSNNKYLIKTHHFTKWKEKLALTFIVTKFIENIITVGRIRYLGEKNVFLAFFDRYELEKILTPSKDGAIIDSFSISL